MKKVLLFLLLFLVVGCTKMKDDYNQETSKSIENEIIGIWDLPIPIENNGWYISSTYFYGNNKCSIMAATSTAGGINVLANAECTYEISGLNIYIDNHLAFRYDEESGTLVDAEDSGIKHIKTNDDPCATIYSYCK